MLKKSIMGIFLAILLAPTTASALGLEEQVDGLFQSYQGDRPGASIAIFQNNQIILEKGYGLANVESGEISSANTNYRLASVSKAFTAMAIMILKERKQIDYSDTLDQFFRAFPVYGSKITVRHLLGHTSGLRDYEDYIPRNQTEQLSDADVVSILMDRSNTYFTPGSEYRYSNSGYATLAEIVRIVSGKPFEVFLKENIFEPLGMSSSLAYVAQGPEVPERAYGYSYNGRFYRTDQSVTSAVLGDGGIYTSVHEYFLWDQALYGNQLVSEETLTEAFTPGRLNNGSRTNYGFGWKLDRYRNNLRISHTGSTIGFRTAVQRFPDRNLTVIVLINREGSAPWTIAENIVDFLL